MLRVAKLIQVTRQLLERTPCACACMRMHATRKFLSHKQLRRSNWTELNSVVLLGSFHSAEYNKFEDVVNPDSSAVCLS
jgi:hypothetical protein